LQHELLQLLRVRHGHFHYESGDHGDVWLDLDELFLRPARLRPLVVELSSRLKPLAPEVICGPMTGGALLASMIAAELELAFVVSERVEHPSVKYRLSSTARQAACGKRVAVVDDAINAGSAVGATINELEACGAKLVAVAALLALGNRATRIARAHSTSLVFLADLPANLWPAAQCPLCARAMPLES
jgi:orotate phosphoribosyltransferase